MIIILLVTGYQLQVPYLFFVICDLIILSVFASPNLPSKEWV